MKKFNLVAVGGTFDRLHSGHKELLKTAFSVSEKVTIGITSDQMIRNKKLHHLIFPYEQRKTEVEKYLLGKGLAERIKIVKLYDPYGPLLTNKKIQAVIVGPRIEANVLENLKGKMKVVHCQTIRSEDSRYLSSTRIRKGEVARDGHVYIKENSEFVLPEILRNRLRVPLGKLTKKQPFYLNKNKSLIISVGDASTSFLNKNKVKMDLAIVDFKIKRKKVFNSFEELGFKSSFKKSYAISNIINKAGTISSSLISQIKKSFERLLGSKKREIIKIDGEDDLAVLPVVLLAPLSSVVFYGQPNEGLVKVVVTEEKKKEIARIVSSFEIKRS